MNPSRPISSSETTISLLGRHFTEIMQIWLGGTFGRFISFSSRDPLDNIGPWMDAPTNPLEDHTLIIFFTSPYEIACALP